MSASQTRSFYCWVSHQMQSNFFTRLLAATLRYDAPLCSEHQVHPAQGKQTVFHHLFCKSSRQTFAKLELIQILLGNSKGSSNCFGTEAVDIVEKWLIIRSAINSNAKIADFNIVVA